MKLKSNLISSICYKLGFFVSGEATEGGSEIKHPLSSETTNDRKSRPRPTENYTRKFN